MRLLIIRHGDPDYENDTLTEKGWREARLLAERLCKMNIKDFYVSPLGRAQATASWHHPGTSVKAGMAAASFGM